MIILLLFLQNISPKNNTFKTSVCHTFSNVLIFPGVFNNKLHDLRISLVWTNCLPSYNYLHICISLLQVPMVWVVPINPGEYLPVVTMETKVPPRKGVCRTQVSIPRADPRFQWRWKTPPIETYIGIYRSTSSRWTSPGLSYTAMVTMARGDLNRLLHIWH